MFSRIESYIAQLQADPVNFLITMAYTWGVILFSLILHECAHGYVALKCGDPTAKMLGRLSLNPARHLDPLGTLCMFLLGFGWAKPVPVNPRNFRHYRRDYIIVSLAGIVTNLLICILSLIISAILAKFIWGKEIVSQMGDKALLINIYEGFLPYYVYSGELKALADYAQIPWLMYVQRLFLMLAQMNLGLAIFNLLPVPPLDGFRFMDQFVFKGRLALSAQTMQTIHVVFLVICMSGALSGVLSAANSAVMGALTSVISLII